MAARINKLGFSPGYKKAQGAKAELGERLVLLYAPAMSIRYDVEASAYFRTLVKLQQGETPRMPHAEVEALVRSRLSLCARHYDEKTQERVRRQFNLKEECNADSVRTGCRSQ